MTGGRKRMPKRSTGEIVTDLITNVVVLDGRRMSMREVMLRALQNASLGGDMVAARELQKLRNASGVNDYQVAGLLVVPEEIPLDEWERLAYEQQAKYREKNYGEGTL